MVRFFFAAALLIPLFSAQAQQPAAPAPAAAVPPKRPWTWTLVTGINGTQAQYRDWAPGGVNSMAATGSFHARGAYAKGHWTGFTDLKLRYGGARIERLGFRKTDDLVHFQNSANYARTGSSWSAYVQANLQTQIYEGRDRNGAVISDFMSPVYFFEGLGGAYKPVAWFNAKGGLMLKQTYVSDTLFAPGFGVRTGEHWRNEGGLSTAVRVEREIMKNVMLKSGLDTFTNLTRSYRDTDVMFTAEFIGRINKNLTTNFQAALAYDSDILRKIQAKQVLSVGLTFQIL